MNAIPTKQLDGDLSVGRHVTVGDKLTVQGSGTINHNLKVGGWLDAPNIKGINKGLFATVDELKEAYSKPVNGWIAMVGNSFPAALWRVVNGVWTDTGKTIDSPGLDTQLQNYLSSLNQYIADVDSLRTELSALQNYGENGFERVDTEMNAIDARIDALLGNNASEAIDNFNEVLAFLGGITDDATLVGKLADINASIKHLRVQLDEAIAKKLDTAVWDDWCHQFNVENIYINTSGGIVGNADYVCSGYLPLNTDYAVTLRTQSSVKNDVLRIGIFDGHKKLLTTATAIESFNEGYRISPASYPAGAAFYAVSTRKENGGSYTNAPTREGVLYGIAQRLMALSGLINSVDAALKSEIKKNTAFRNAFGEGAEVSINGLQKAVVSDAAKRESLTDVCRALGVTYNTSTGKYTLNGLTDITYDELTEIYARRGQIGPAGYFQYAGFPCRTNLLTQKTSRYVSGIAYCFNGSTDVEVVNLGSTITVKAQDEGMTRAFTGCRRLHTIMGQLSLGSKPAVTETFSECRALREVRIASLGTNISFEDSPMLTYSTLNYLVEHAANTEEITVTVHEGVMALLSGAQSLYDTPRPFTAEEWKRYTKPGTAVEFYWPDLQGYAAGDYVVISGTARDTRESYYGIGRVLEVVTDEDGSNMRPRVAAVCGGTGSPGDLAAWSLLKVTAARHEIYFATTE